MENWLHSELTSDLGNVLSRHVQHWDSGGLRQPPPPPHHHSHHYHHVGRRESAAVIERVQHVSCLGAQINDCVDDFAKEKEEKHHQAHHIG